MANDNPRPMEDGIEALRAARAAFRAAQKPVLVDEVDEMIRQIEADIRWAGGWSDVVPGRIRLNPTPFDGGRQ